MRITHFYDTNLDRIDSKSHNIYLAVSINNQYFSQERIRQYLKWGLMHTREKFAIVLVDVIQAFNNQILNSSTPAAAMRRALKVADKMEQLCQELIGELSSEEAQKVVLLRWNAVTEDANFQYNLSLLMDAFDQDPVFRNYILDTVKNNLGNITQRLNEEKINFISQYLLHEGPEVICGFEHGGIHFDLDVYPGKIWQLPFDLSHDPRFRQLYQSLRIPKACAIVEAYADDLLHLS